MIEEQKIKKLSTKRLYNVYKQARAANFSYSDLDVSEAKYISELKSELDKREHIPRKKKTKKSNFLKRRHLTLKRLVKRYLINLSEAQIRDWYVDFNNSYKNRYQVQPYKFNLAEILSMAKTIQASQQK